MKRLFTAARCHKPSGAKAELGSHPLLPCLFCQHPTGAPGVELEYDSTLANLGPRVPLALSFIFFLSFFYAQQFDPFVCIYYLLSVIYLEEND